MFTKRIISKTRKSKSGRGNTQVETTFSLGSEDSAKTKLEQKKAKYNYKLAKQREKTKRAKYAAITGGTTGTTASVGGSVVGTANASNPEEAAKTYTYNYFVSSDADNINPMESSPNAGTGSTISYYKPGSEK